MIINLFIWTVLASVYIGLGIYIDINNVIKKTDYFKWMIFGFIGGSTLTALFIQLVMPK